MRPAHALCPITLTPATIPMLRWLTRRRRAELRKHALAPEWRAIIEKNVPFGAKLSDDDRAELAGHVRVFLAAKHFEGCGGMVLRQEFEALVDKTRQRHRSVIDGYGDNNPAEFFAVVTEAFFEKTRQLRANHPELYAEFQQFYQQDPASLKAR